MLTERVICVRLAIAQLDASEFANEIMFKCSHK